MSAESRYYQARVLGLAADLRRLLNLADQTWSDHLALCERAALRTNPAVVIPTTLRLRELTDQVERFSSEAGRSIGWDGYLDACEAFRMLVRDLATVATTHDWQSPAYDSTLRPHVFHPEDHGYRGMLGYRRVHHPLLTRLEAHYLLELGYSDDRLVCHLTGAGMSAFTMVESWLVRDRLRDGDRLAYMARTYFEAREQLSKLKGVVALGVELHSHHDAIEAVRTMRPRALFLEPVNNENQTTLIDVPALVTALSRLSLDDDLYLVVDTSMSAGGEGPLFDTPGLDDNPRLHLVQLESLLKYRQHGLDRANAGVVLAPRRFARELFVQRERCGAFLPDVQAFEMLAFRAAAHEERMRRIKEGCEEFCARVWAALPADLRGTISLSTPIATSHPDHDVYRRAYRYLGGVVPISFTVERGPDELAGVIDATLARCRRAGIVLHHSTSFGFTATHIGIAATGGSRMTRPFLRVSVGEDPVANLRQIADSLAASLVTILSPVDVR